MAILLKEKLEENYTRRYAKITKIKQTEMDRWKDRADYDGHITYKHNDS